MPYALNGTGTIITQTGVDADLSGLAAVAGVTTFTIGTGERAFNAYHVGTRHLQTTGTQDVDPQTEMLVTSATGDRGIEIRSGGTLNVNGFYEYNGKRFYSTRRWFHHTNLANYTNIGFWARNGSTVNLIGGEIFCPKGIQFDASSVVLLEGCIVDNHELTRTGASTTSSQQIRQASTALTVNGFTNVRGFFTIIAAPLTLIGYRPMHCFQALAFSSSTPDVNLLFTGYDSDGSSTKDVSNWRGNRPVLVNSVRGPRLLIGPNTNNNVSSYGFVRSMSEVTHPVIAPSGAPIADAYAIRLRDVDSGGRGSYSVEGFTGDPYVAEQDFSYVAKTDGTGVADSVVMSSMQIANVGAGSAINAGAYAPDYRFDQALSFSQTDPYNEPQTPTMGFTYWAVGRLSGTGAASMEGAGASVAGTTLFLDAAYTGVATAPLADAEAAYNAAHAWYADQLEVLLANTDTIDLTTLAGLDVEPVMLAAASTVRTVLEALGGAGVLPLGRAGATLTSVLPLRFAAAGDPIVCDGVTSTVHVGATYTGGVTSPGLTVDAGVAITAGTYTGGVTLLGGPQTIVAVTADVLTFSVAGAYVLDGGSVGEVLNVSGGAVTIDRENGATVAVNTGPNITINEPESTLTILGVPAGAEYRIYDDELDGFDRGTELAGVEVHAGGPIEYTYIAANDVVLQVIHTGYLEFTAPLALVAGDSVFSVSLVPDPFL